MPWERREGTDCHGIVKEEKDCNDFAVPISYPPLVLCVSETGYCSSHFQIGDRLVEVKCCTKATELLGEESRSRTPNSCLE